MTQTHKTRIKMNLGRTTLRGVAAALSTVSVFTLPASAEGTRHADAHVHGTGHLNMAVDGTQIALELRAPGADIVGFEHTPESDADKKAVEDALAVLSDPLTLFVMPEAAGCKLVEVEAELHGEEHGDHHGHGEEHSHDDHAHDDHGHDDHGHKEDHAHDDHDGHAHGEEHAEHSEFHAEYLLNCADIDAVDKIEMAYFKTFENAKALEIQMVTSVGATQVELHHDDPYLVIGAN